MDKTTPYYIASPYTDIDDHLRKWRLERACDVTRTLIQLGIPALSPIAHNATSLGAGVPPLGYDFWRIQDEALMNACKKMIVVTLPGWDKSFGVSSEIAFCNKQGYPIHYTDWFSSPAQAAPLVALLLK